MEDLNKRIKKYNTITKLRTLMLVSAMVGVFLLLMVTILSLYNGDKQTVTVLFSLGTLSLVITLISTIIHSNFNKKYNNKYNNEKY